MTTIAKSLNDAGVSLADATAEVGKGIGAFISTAAKSTKLMSNFMDKTIEQQEVRYAIERQDYAARTINEAAFDFAESETRIFNKVSHDEALKSSFMAARERYTQALAIKPE